MKSVSVQQDCEIGPCAMSNNRYSAVRKSARLPKFAVLLNAY